ncbi:hypothetical protein QWY14_05260 [Planococcus sp. N028]|uniref:Uncharacterized protein n=1 Tax=Planococcus shixiaomingii TaxID=3058393 RepID=A0ABT8MZW4_9BACL|nr:MULTISPECIES: hypothetical protein [unclassified Planococcus (in: firmicutes)]MDN7241187.1 hypothetical protein [Planococcus sp. N028]WKA53456.1 hypothetical protein QWY21_12375 [Planococcus sp. N022]
MKLENIKEILQTVSFFNTVEITQTFGKDGTDCVIVKNVKNTRTLQMTFLQTGKVEFYKCLNQAAEAIENELKSISVA